MITVVSNPMWVQGHIRYGHHEMELSEEDYEEFKSMSFEDKKDWMLDVGTLKIDDFEINDYGDIQYFKDNSIGPEEIGQ